MTMWLNSTEVPSPNEYKPPPFDLKLVSLSDSAVKYNDLDPLELGLSLEPLTMSSRSLRHKRRAHFRSSKSSSISSSKSQSFSDVRDLLTSAKSDPETHTHRHRPNGIGINIIGEKYGVHTVSPFFILL